MDAEAYLEGKVTAWLGAARGEAPMELACSRHELRGAAEALRRAGLLSGARADAIVAGYDRRLRDGGSLQRTEMAMGAAATGLAASGPPPSGVARSGPGRFEDVLRPAGSAEGTAADQGELRVLFLERWTGLLVLHYLVPGEPGASRGWHRSRSWHVTDDGGTVYPQLGSGARSSLGGMRGHVELAGPVHPAARRIVVESRDTSGRATSTFELPDPSDPPRG